MQFADVVVDLVFAHGLTPADGVSGIVRRQRFARRDSPFLDDPFGYGKVDDPGCRRRMARVSYHYESMGKTPKEEGQKPVSLRPHRAHKHESSTRHVGQISVAE